MTIDFCSTEYNDIPAIFAEIAKSISEIEMDDVNIPVKDCVRNLLFRKFEFRKGFDKNVLESPIGHVCVIVASTQATVSKYFLNCLSLRIKNIIIVMPNPIMYWVENDYTRTLGVINSLKKIGNLNFNVLAISNVDECLHFSTAEKVRSICKTEFSELPIFGERLLRGLYALHVEKDYFMVAKGFGNSIGSEYHLAVVDQHGNLEPLWPHLIVENSAQGIWQAMLLSFTTSWMPLCWHGLYEAHTYIFSANDLKSANMDAYIRFKSNNIYPSISMKENHAIVKYCYWTECGGLIKKTEEVEIDDQNHIHFLEEKEKKEVLFPYDSMLHY